MTPKTQQTIRLIGKALLAGLVAYFAASQAHVSQQDAILAGVGVLIKSVNDLLSVPPGAVHPVAETVVPIASQPVSIPVSTPTEGQTPPGRGSAIVSTGVPSPAPWPTSLPNVGSSITRSPIARVEPLPPMQPLSDLIGGTHYEATPENPTPPPQSAA